MDEEVLHISTPRHRAPEDVRTLVDLLRGRAEVTPSRVVYGFLADGETEAGVLTFGDLDRQARAIAASLRAADLTGGRALLVYPPSLEYVAAFFGCLYAGIVAVPAYPPDPLRLERTLPRLEAIVRDAQTAAVLTTGELAAMRRCASSRPTSFRLPALTRGGRRPTTPRRSRSYSTRPAQQVIRAASC